MRRAAIESSSPNLAVAGPETPPKSRRGELVRAGHLRACARYLRSYRMSLRLFLVTGLGLLAGCPDRTIAEVVPVQSGVLKKEIPVSADIDILFVIDNSASTLDKQTIFAQNFPKFVQALDAFPTGRPNLHIGVVDSTVDIGAGGYGNGAAGCPSPDPGDDGRLQNTPRIPGCQPPTGAFISDIKNADGSRMTNYSGSLDQALSCIALVGADGCGFEAQLEAMKRALDGSKSENKGFIRNGAYLAVIFLTDEDDASTKDKAVFSLSDSAVGGHNDYRVQPLFAYRCDQSISAQAGGMYTNCAPRTDSYLQNPDLYASFLSSVKDPAQIIVAAIAGPPPGLMTNDNPPTTSDSPNIMTGSLLLNGNTQPLALLKSCSATINGNPAIGRPAVRLASFLRHFGSRGRFYSICQSDYSAALTDIGRTLFNAISPCLEGPVKPTDTDPKNPGTQLECSVTDVQNAGTSTETSSIIPACKMQDAKTPDPAGARPCWWVDNNTTSCPAPDTGFELHLERTQPPAPGTTIDAQCVAESM
jgi:hypothetical protein